MGGILWSLAKTLEDGAAARRGELPPATLARRSSCARAARGASTLERTVARGRNCARPCPTEIDGALQAIEADQRGAWEQLEMQRRRAMTDCPQPQPAGFQRHPGAPARRPRHGARPARARCGHGPAPARALLPRRARRLRVALCLPLLVGLPAHGLRALWPSRRFSAKCSAGTALHRRARAHRAAFSGNGASWRISIASRRRGAKRSMTEVEDHLPRSHRALRRRPRRLARPRASRLRRAPPRARARARPRAAARRSACESARASSAGRDRRAHLRMIARPTFPCARPHRPAR